MNRFALRDYRIKKDISEQEMAEALGVDLPTLWGIESNARGITTLEAQAYAKKLCDDSTEGNKKMSNITITIEGCCSMTKSELAKDIGEFLKGMTFGQVKITGADERDYYKGLLRDETVEIRVVPEELNIRDGFQGNREFAKKRYEEKKVILDEVI